MLVSYDRCSGPEMKESKKMRSRSLVGSEELEHLKLPQKDHVKIRSETAFKILKQQKTGIRDEDHDHVGGREILAALE
jgi:hypothetical protein